MVVPKHISESTFYVNKYNKALSIQISAQHYFFGSLLVAPSRIIDGGRWGKLPATAPADRQRGSVTKGRKPASAPKVLFVYKDVLMKCIGSLLIWKLGEGASRTCL